MAVDWIYDSHVMKFLRVVKFNMKILKETAALQEDAEMSCIINLAFLYIHLPLHVLGSYIYI